MITKAGYCYYYVRFYAVVDLSHACGPFGSTKNQKLKGIQRSCVG